MPMRHSVISNKHQPCVHRSFNFTRYYMHIPIVELNILYSKQKNPNNNTNVDDDKA